MALLSTGGDLAEREAATLVQSGLLLGGGERRSEERASSEVEEIQIYDGELLLDSSLLLGGGQPNTGNSIGNFSPVYSPVSNASADSGLGGSGGLISPTAENDTFLAELFGSDFPLLSQSYSTTAIAHPTTTSTSTESAPLAAVSSKPTSAVPNGIGPLFSSFSLKHMQTEQIQQQDVPTETSSKINKESEAERNRKNAEAARQNRLKKKRYLEELEKEHSDVKRENVILKTRCHEFQQRCQRLQSEVEYLKNVIANESTLSSLIQNIPSVPNVKLSSSFSSRKRPQAGSSSSEDSAPASKRSKSSQSGASAGICLHVAKDQVSIEFCQHCSKQATQS
jgi:hypothetical protein